ncbi:hypothetical protein [Clostridium perfringens]|uniref:hypothetical protein n=2 Tax=Clostridium perfringens TaxID=1502 RepID=UPI000D71BC09|nr:hypothetical protein [Clostridium perfringens]PWX46960.1 hypothetical protein CYK61_14095 [Clostridium perfringens]HAT4117244.1 hypothetical protein [Clostridium perfringens]HBC2031677.1 hypothetical protein [Clostridium perfringens]HBC2035036.1 hypothetical protein [Clostridium perfringens]HBC2058199.1 hypothetical protein [Clostridium perfringens]
MNLKYNLSLNDTLIGEKKIIFQKDKNNLTFISEDSILDNNEKNIIEMDNNYTLLNIETTKNLECYKRNFNVQKLLSNEKIYVEEFFIINLPNIFEENKQFYLILNPKNYEISYVRVLKKTENKFIMLNPEYLYLSYDSSTRVLKYCENLISGLIMQLKF